jgi:EAL domain-containing protein (putative c-di-GMP-specific phosphodiesterase class I)/GGDEF domain-containing protein
MYSPSWVNRWQTAIGKLMATGTTDVFLKRNRFVAFAFAAADVFLEIDCDETVQFADGATQWLTGEQAPDLTGRPFFDFIAENDQSLVRAALSTQVDKGRLGPIAAGFVHRDGRTVRADLSGMRLPGDEERVFLSLGAPRISTVSIISDDIARDDKTGLLTKESFTDVATRALHSESTSGEPSHMTLLDLGGLDALKERIGGEAAAGLLDEISAHLRANSLSGNAAGQIEGEQFGMVHAPHLDVAALTDAIETSARHVDATGKGVVATAATIPLDPGTLSDADNGRALLYAMNKFSESHADFTINELSAGYQEMLDETLRDIATFKRIIEDNEFDALYQPIVDLEEREIHHYEALARIRDMEAESSPYRFITFAEEVGVIGDFDIAMTRKVIAMMQAARDNDNHLSVAVNLSTRSLETPSVVDALLATLKGCDAIRKQLLFEVTESWRINDLEAVNRVLGSLRNLGHAICLDDFGAGAAAFQYLKALDVDYVKIDGVYVREAFTKPNGKAYLESMATLCRELGVETVGEMVETEQEAELLKDVGVTYGQGYLFGKPSMGLLSVNNNRPTARATAAR